MASNTLTITDNRNAKNYELPIENGTIRAMDLRKIKTGPEDFGLMTYDPAFMNTASCRSAITFIDGDKGILRYRGYPIEVLAEHCTYLEVAYLLLFGDLPSPADLKNWVNEITHHTMLHENTKQFMEGFRHDAHPMAMLVSTVAALSASYPEARANSRSRQPVAPDQTADWQDTVDRGHVVSAQSRLSVCVSGQRSQLSGKFHEHVVEDGGAEVCGQPCDWPARWTFFSFFMPTTSRTAAPTPCGRWAAPRPIRTCQPQPRRLPWPDLCTAEPTKPFCIMLDEIGSKANVPAYIKKIKEGKGKLMGFGHRVYKNYDPRAKIIKWTAEKVFAVTGGNPKLDIALELERIALEDEYFVTRKLYPNVDFYSGIIYQAMGFRPEMFTVLFAIPRTAGWLAQWQELVTDPEQKIARPRQVYTGHDVRQFVPPEKRASVLAAR